MTLDKRADISSSPATDLHEPVNSFATRNAWTGATADKHVATDQNLTMQSELTTSNIFKPIQGGKGMSTKAIVMMIL